MRYFSIRRRAGCFLGGLVLAISFIAVSIGYSAESREVEDHQATISWLEKKAQAQDEIIAWHKKMRDSAVGRSYGTENIPSGTDYEIMGREMQSHCDEIIQAAEKLKTELQSFADWHKDKVALKSDASTRENIKNLLSEGKN